MNEFFIFYYITMSIFSIAFMEHEVKHNSHKLIGYVWKQCTIVERVGACLIPIYREFILVMVYVQNKKNQ